MESMALDGSECWQCGQKQGRATNVTSVHPMKVGDVVVCPYCSAISIVDEQDGALSPRPPDTTGPDKALLDNSELINLMFSRIMYISGLVSRKCPRCNARVLMVGQIPRLMDEVDCECGARLYVKGDYSLGLKGQ